MQIKAHAKVNWALNVVGLRADGYHLLDMLTQRLELADVLTITPLPLEQNIQLHILGDDTLATNEDNLVYRAAAALQSLTGFKAGTKIVLQKNIPQQSGLGGGSADAAAAILALNHVWGLNLNFNQLLIIAEKLGADVPLCLYQGLCRVQGFGEKVQPIIFNKQYHLVLLKPSGGLSTKDVFSLYDNNPDRKSAQLEELTCSLLSGNLKTIPLYAHNQLQQTAQIMQPNIGDAISALMDSGAIYAQMTGAGSAVFGIFSSEISARRAETSLRLSWPLCIYTKTFLQ